MTSFDGVVLCGGESRRMGQDKAVLEIAGRAMALRVADALHAAGASVVVALGGDRARLEALGLVVVDDAGRPVGTVDEAACTGVDRFTRLADVLDPAPLTLPLDTAPREVFEASTIDGAGIIRSFWSIGLPMVRNALFTIGLVQFTASRSQRPPSRSRRDRNSSTPPSSG